MNAIESYIKARKEHKEIKDTQYKLICIVIPSDEHNKIAFQISDEINPLPQRLARFICKAINTNMNALLAKTKQESKKDLILEQAEAKKLAQQIINEV